MDTPKPPEPPKPAKGNVLSTVHVRRVSDAYIAIEHPKGMTEDEVLSELRARALDFAPRVSWWGSDEQHTTIDHVYLDDFDPDDKGAKPFVLGHHEEAS